MRPVSPAARRSASRSSRSRGSPDTACRTRDNQPPQLIQEFAAPGWSYREEAKHFLECVRSGAPFHSSAEDTLYDVKLYEDIYRAFLGL